MQKISIAHIILHRSTIDLARDLRQSMEEALACIETLARVPLPGDEFDRAFRDMELSLKKVQENPIMVGIRGGMS
jgi:hypothetical protein